MMMEQEQKILQCEIVLKRNPYLLQEHEKLAHLYEEAGRYLESYKEFCITETIAEQIEKWDILNICESGKKRVLERLEKIIPLISKEQQNLLLKEALPNMQQCEENRFGYLERRFNTIANVAGRYYFENEISKKYVGKYHGCRLFGDNEEDAVHQKVEIREVTEATCVEVPKTADEWIVPVAVENKNTYHQINETDGQKKLIVQHYEKSFYYYRVKGGSEILSSDLCYYGKFIPLKTDPHKKRLVLNIFVDGLSQAFFTEENFKKYMPNTADYFKRGMICTQAYTSGEWTYPSIAGIMSGLPTTKHMMFHNKLDWRLPEDLKTLSEYFHEAGYYTTFFSSDWRIIPSYGYARGCDRFLYQHYHTNAVIEKMIGSVISEIEALKEINQYVWMSIGDLHDIADELELPTAVQTKLEIQAREMRTDSTTSVKQFYDRAKQRQYEEMMRYIDCYLGMLFSYLQNTFKDDEIIVSLFSDHGQGYLIPENGEFLAPERSNIAFMFRDGKHEGYTSEVMSSLDYAAVMCHLAGIPYDGQNTFGKLPQIFGGSGRKWAVTESIHPNDPYRAALVSEQYRFYFCNPYPVGFDGRFKLGDYTAALTDKEGNVIYNEDVVQECLNIVMEHIVDFILKEEE